MENHPETESWPFFLILGEFVVGSAWQCSDELVRRLAMIIQATMQISRHGYIT